MTTLLGLRDTTEKEPIYETFSDRLNNCSYNKITAI